MSSKTKRGEKVILARAGKVITLPWWKKTCWVSVPVEALGCSGATGTLSTDELWIQPRPGGFSPDSMRLLFRVESSRLKSGKEYRPQITVRTDAGLISPQLVFKKAWPWVLAEAVLLAAVIGVMMVMR